MTTHATHATHAAPVPPEPRAPGAEPVPFRTIEAPPHSADVYVGDCRDVLPRLNRPFDLIFADPPFNWNRGYDQWNDSMKHQDYLDFTYLWLDLCRERLRPGGAMWVNIPDDWAAEIVVHMKKPDPARNQPLMLLNNWCIWHYRFGQNTTSRFISSKVHVLYFVKPGRAHTWNTADILEPSDRASTYFDARTLAKKDGMPAGKRVPLDVWYGQYFGRVQGNNKERRGYHDNQLPEAYLERVIRSTSNEGDLVLDPFLGSGTTGVMALALKRNFVGIEFSDENARRAADRIETGPVRLGGAKGSSSAIFRARGASAKVIERFRNETKG